MPATIRIVRYGEDARLALSARLEECKKGDPLSPVTVVVRSALAGLDLRRRLAATTGLVNVRFSVLARLAELLGGPELTATWTGRDYPSPLTEVVLGASVRRALGEDPGILLGVAHHAATEVALAATYRDLRQSSDEELERLSECGTRAADVVRITSRARRLVAGAWYDADDVADAAAEALREGRARVGDIGPVIVQLPGEMRESELGLLVALSARTPLHCIVGLSGDDRADPGLLRLADRLAERLGCELSEPPPSAGGAGRLGPARTFGEVVSAPDPEAEVREAIRRVLAHAGAGQSPGHCAIAHPGSRRYARLLAEQLDAAGIPWNGPAPDTLARTPAALVLAGLVELADPGSELARSGVISWLGRGPIVTATGEPVPLGGWDRSSREAGVVAGIEEWRSRLGAHAERCALERPAQALLATGLCEFVERLTEVCSELLACQSWGAFSLRARAALAEYLGPAVLRSPAGRASAGVRRGEAPAVGEIRRRIELALDELAALDAIESLGVLPVELRHERITRSLATALSRPAPRVGRFGRGVAVAPISALVGVETDLLVVVGAVEGELPGRPADDPLLPRGERVLAGSPASAAHESSEIGERRDLVALLCAAANPVATTARLDHRRGRANVASRWLEADLAAGATTTTIGSFAETLRRVGRGAVPACDPLDYELASMLAWSEAGQDTRDHFLASLATGFAAALGVRSARLAWSLNRFNGQVGPRPPDPDDGEKRPARLLSATTVETYAACPFRGFLRHQLHLEDIDAPERRTTIEPKDRGSLVHAVLERLVKEVIESDQAFSGWAAADHVRIVELAREEFEDYEGRGLVGRALVWELEKSQILLELDRFLDSDNRFCLPSGRVPVAAEYRFGGDGVEPLEVFAAGRSVGFGGKIDRVDRADDGSLTVVDYKTGSSGSFTVLDSDPVGRGERLQLALYGLAAEAGLGPAGAERGAGPADDGEVEGALVSAEYRFVSARADRESIGIVLDANTRARLGEALDTLVGMIDGGTFPARPGPPDRASFKNCHWCEFDALCSADRDQAWERVRADPHLGGYASMVEPEDGGEGEIFERRGARDAL